VDVAVVDARAHRGEELQLQFFHGPHQAEEAVIDAGAGGVRAGNVAGVAAELRAGVDQEGGSWHVAVATQRRVVQDRRAFAERDDVAVGQFLLAQADCRAVGLVDLELRGACPVGRCRRDMSTCPQARSRAQAGEFVRRLGRAMVVQEGEQAGRVHGTEAPVGELRRRFADQRQPAIAGVKQVARVTGFANHGEIKFAGPGRGRHLGGLMPVIGRLVKDQLRPAARQVADEAVRRLLQRGPLQEVGVGLEGGTMIVEEVQPGAAGIDDQAVTALAFQGPLGEAANMLQVRGKQPVD
jgi:hypothetical protein